MFSIINIFLAIVAVYIALDYYKKKTLDLKGLILKAIKICLIIVVVKGLVAAANAILEPAFIDSLMNRTVDVVIANVLIGAISMYLFLNIDKPYKFIADIVFGLYDDIKGIVMKLKIPKRASKKTPDATETSS